MPKTQLSCDYSSNAYLSPCVGPIAFAAFDRALSIFEFHVWPITKRSRGPFGGVPVCYRRRLRHSEAKRRRSGHELFKTTVSTRSSCRSAISVEPTIPRIGCYSVVNSVLSGVPKVKSKSVNKNIFKYIQLCCTPSCWCSVRVRLPPLRVATARLARKSRSTTRSWAARDSWWTEAAAPNGLCDKLLKVFNFGAIVQCHRIT